jgi:AcrR family transcriptional regulator
MGRRADHKRDELEELILSAGQQLMAENGYGRFSAREVAKRIGYSVGTIMHVFGNVDRLVMMINSQTFALWAKWLEERLARASDGERISVLVKGYFDFASTHRNLWAALYEHRVPERMAMAEALVAKRVHLTDIIGREVAAVLPGKAPADADRIARSLIATVHGHCSFALGGSFGLMGEIDPLGLAMARVTETLQANGAAVELSG